MSGFGFGASCLELAGLIAELAIVELDELRSGKWYAQLGNTICIQPRQLSPFTYVTIDLQTMQYDRHIVEG